MLLGLRVSPTPLPSPAALQDQEPALLPSSCLHSPAASTLTRFPLFEFVKPPRFQTTQNLTFVFTLTPGKLDEKRPYSQTQFPKMRVRLR